MILFAGILLFVGIAVWRSWRLLQSPYEWKATNGGVEGGYYTDQIWRWFRIDMAFAIHMRSPMRFTIKRESWLDRLWKTMGFATEFQLGNSAFDEHLYIVCDDAAWCQLLESKPEIQKLIQLMFLAGATELTLNGRGLHLIFKSKSSTLMASEAEIVGWLRALATYMAEFGPYAERTVNSSYKLQAVIIEGIQTALLMVGVPCLFVAWIHSGLQFTWSPLLIAALKWTVGIGVIWLFFIRIVMRSSSRSAPVITHFATIGFAGLFLSISAIMYDYNAEFDRQDPTIYKIQITAHAYVDRIGEKRWYQGRNRGFKIPTITIMPWRDGQEQQELFKLEEKEYNQHMRFYYQAPQVAHYLQITFKHGALGYSWIEEYALLDPLAKP